MAMKIKNISEGKIIGIGKTTILPGETKELPESYENNPVVKHYEGLRLVEISGKSSSVKKTADQKAAEKAKKAEEEAKAAEELRKARLASLEGITEEALGALANELGVNMAECKDQADVLAKVKELLEK